ncbi:2-dehydro-3-deoxygalactonokinase [Pseudoruegeria sp. SK021]|uniref:2-dehydro-3-deoxygalactonokinase n=1 Tax=Pseudoruegeria sp. SK021 TaxID=1933035 RepID=UPI000A21976C|nr:2-dehydro-3-deoxygalactonokinase [Pseudoruegeria sp. SK021]OSP56497.1 hypothetical protein BV911_00605 [Pseudoruegeria sp. SK021]
MEHQEPSGSDWIAAILDGPVLRVWRMSGRTAQDSAEMSLSEDTPNRAQLTDALTALVQPWRDAPPGDAPIPVLLSGYLAAQPATDWPTVPSLPLPAEPITIPCADPRLHIRAVPGLRQTTPTPDLLCGAETCLAGFLAYTPDFDGVACLPGNVSRWVRVSAGEIVSFRSFLTGGLHQALADHSVLRHSLTAAPSAQDWDETAFLATLDDAMAHPARLTAALFGIRADGLQSDLSPVTAQARLAGRLLGAELLAARPYWRDHPVAVLAPTATARPYVAALTHLGPAPLLADAAAMTRAGLDLARTGRSAPPRPTATGSPSARPGTNRRN